MVVLIHVHAERFDRLVPLLNHQVSLGLRNALLGLRLPLLNHCHRIFDEGLKVHLQGPERCHGSLRNRCVRLVPPIEPSPTQKTQKQTLFSGKRSTWSTSGKLLLIDISCGIKTGRPRATDDFHSLRVRLQTNFSFCFLPGQRFDPHRDQEADTNRLINIGGRANNDNQF